MVKDFTNKEIAVLFKAVSAAYEIKGENPFQVIAYDRAASSIESLSSDIKDLWDDNKLNDVPGIGSSMTGHLDELFKTGKVKHFEDLFKNLPKGMFVLIPIPGIGAKIAYRLASEFGLDNPKTSVSQLLKLAKEGKIRNLEGFGEQSEKEIIKNIEQFQKRSDRMLLPEADLIAQSIIKWLHECPEVARVEPLGSLRRMVTTIGDIDIAVASNNPQKVIQHFLNYPRKVRQIEAGENTASILVGDGKQIDLMIQPVESFGALLQHFTGSKLHNIALREYALKKGLSLSEYGIKKMVNGKCPPAKASLKRLRAGLMVNYSSEEKFYQALGLEWIPPELREGTEEIDLAKRNQLPKLVELSDIKGDLHIHSNFPIETSHDEGFNTMEEVIKKAVDLNYEYIAFTEHNPSFSQHTQKQTLEILKRKREQIVKIVRENRVNNIPIHIFNSLEVDIRPDGDLSISEEAFEYLDFAIVSVHSSFNLDKNKMTSRVLKGLSHPKALIFGHPTGRKLNEREGIELDWDQILNFCAENSKVLEINAWPDRLDLPDNLIKEAVKRKVKMIINTDSHEISQMGLMKYGVAMARRGWAQKEDILNTLSYGKIKNIILK
jgi:DNA polymerase (family X)